MTDKEKLVELLDSHCDYAGHVDCKDDCTKCLADHLLANGVTVQGWIPVSVQKPEENKDVKVYSDGHVLLISVLVCGENRGVHIANRYHISPVGIPYLDEHATDGWEWSVGSEDVTHWMLLPEPPKGE